MHRLELFIFPYFAIYLGGWALGIRLDMIRWAFVALHVAYGTYLVRGLIHWATGHAPTRSAFWRSADGAFWLALALFFLIPGAYLEFPSDAWEHVRRLLDWGESDTIAASLNRLKFAYFFGWTLLSWVPPLQIRSALAVYGAFWELLVAWQVYALSKDLGFDKRWSKVSVLGFLCFFGSGLFGLRYYALSSTPLAYFLFLLALRTLLQETASLRSRLLLTVGCLVAIGLNHLQEIMFTGLIGSTILIDQLLTRMSPQRKRFLLKAGAVTLLVGGLATAGYVKLYSPAWIPTAWRSHVYGWGIFRLSVPAVRVVSTLGVPGIAALVLALAFIKKTPRLSILTLLPFACLVFPPTVIALIHVLGEQSQEYRILYAFPPSLILVEACRRFLSKYSEKWAPVLASGVLMTVGLQWQAPWYGRLRLQVHRPPAERTLVDQDQTAEWLRANRPQLKDCIVLTDNMTDFAVTAILGRPFRSGRLVPSYTSRKLPGIEEILRLNTEEHFCGVMAAIDSRIPPTPPSEAARLSGHWNPDLGDIHWFQGENFASAAAKLPALGWSHVSVPPYYDLYEPPTRLGPIER